jgi:hypothetical protein
VLENTDQNSVLFGSGWGRTKEQQLAGLSYNAAYAIEQWLMEQKEQLNWFTDLPILDAPPEQPDTSSER